MKVYEFGTEHEKNSVMFQCVEVKRFMDEEKMQKECRK